MCCVKEEALYIHPESVDVSNLILEIFNTIAALHPDNYCLSVERLNKNLHAPPWWSDPEVGHRYFVAESKLARSAIDILSLELDAARRPNPAI